MKNENETRAIRLGSASATLVASTGDRMAIAAASFDATAAWAEGEGSRADAAFQAMRAQGALDLGASDDERIALSRAAAFFVSTKEALS